MLIMGLSLDNLTIVVALSHQSLTLRAINLAFIGTTLISNTQVTTIPRITMGKAWAYGMRGAMMPVHHRPCLVKGAFNFILHTYRPPLRANVHTTLPFWSLMTASVLVKWQVYS